MKVEGEDEQEGSHEPLVLQAIMIEQSLATLNA